MKNDKIIFAICLLVTIIMLVSGFLVPPTGVIDGSVLTAVGELFAFATLSKLPSLIHGRSVELKHGSTTLSLGDDDEEKKEVSRETDDNSNP